MIDVYCKHSKMVDPTDLVDHPRNGNRHPKQQIEALAGNIKEFGWRHPVIVSNLSGVIVMGHCRRDAALELGCQAPVDYQDFSSEEEELAVLVADNIIPELAEMDDEILMANKELIEAAGFDLLIVGIDLDGPIENEDTDKSGTSPWDRVGNASDGVMFSFGEIQKRMPEEAYNAFIEKIDPQNIEEWLLEAIYH